jgi:hypothetical protein
MLNKPIKLPIELVDPETGEIFQAYTRYTPVDTVTFNPGNKKGDLKMFINFETELESVYYITSKN